MQNEPNNYPYLLTDGLSHGQVLSGDGFVFEYNAYTGAWSGGEYFEVGGPDPFAVTITNIHNHMNCFNPNLQATVSINVDQPINGNSACENFMNVGHTFLTIQQGGVARTIGFYPANKAYPGNPAEPMQYKDNAGKSWDVSVSIDISAGELQALLNHIENQTPSVYHLNDFNCTTWVVQAFGAMNINLPQNQVWFPFKAGLCPGAFGENLRNLTIPGRSTTISSPWQTGSAPANAGNCPN